MWRLIAIEAHPRFDAFDRAHEIGQIGKGMQAEARFERHKLAVSDALDNRRAAPRRPIRLDQSPLVEF